MTEQEAKKKWCPLGQISVIGTAGIQAQMCVASDCMLWRHNGIKDIKIDRGYMEPPDIETVEIGYCGLANKP
jgi:hypothetical protein